MLTVAGRVRRGVKNGGQLLGGSGVSCSSQTWDIANQGVLLVAAASRRLFGRRPPAAGAELSCTRNYFVHPARRRDAASTAGETPALRKSFSRPIDRVSISAR